MLRVRGVSVGLLAAGLLAFPATASSAVSESFFSGGDAGAGWETVDPGPAGSEETQSIALEVNGSSPADFDDFAGVRLDGVPEDAPASPPSFAFQPTVDDPGSGGSPRLVIRFDDGGSLQLRPLSWTSGGWVTVDGGGNLWDNQGGTCGFLFATTYATGLACHSGAAVTGVSVTSDSGWFHPGGYIHYIDDISYGDALIDRPSLCTEDLSGSQESGAVSGPVRSLHEGLGSSEGGFAGETVKHLNCDVVVSLGL